MKITRRAASAGLLALGSSTRVHAQAAMALKVRVDWIPWGIHAGLHLANEKGWFKEAGLNVEVSDGKGSSLTLQQVATGDVDVGQVQLGPMAIARAQGMPVTSIGGLARRGDLGAIVPKDENLRTVKDLEGKKVVYSAASAWGPLVEPFLRSGGTDRSKVQLLNVDQTSLMAVYTSKNADAVLTTYPFAKPTADKLRASQGILLADVGINLPSYGLVTSQAVLKNKEAALRAFVPVVVRAWEYIYSGHVEEGVQAIASQRPNERLDLDIVRGQIVEFEPFFVTDATKGKRFGWQAESDWRSALDTLEITGSIPKGTKPADYFTNAFVTE